MATINFQRVETITSRADLLSNFATLDIECRTKGMIGDGYGYDRITMFLPEQMFAKAQRIADAINAIMAEDAAPAAFQNAAE